MPKDTVDALMILARAMCYSKSQAVREILLHAMAQIADPDFFT